jgi:2-dehydro-3-deoxygalactonokinase
MLLDGMKRAMRWIEGYIAVDWGTTNRRGYRMDSDGRCQAEFEDGRGILSIAQGGFGDAVAELRRELGDLPLLLAGMVGSNRGWVEAPYVPCPAKACDLAERLIWAEPDRAAIVPGLSITGQRFDVMRGEEVQLFGAVAAGLVPPTARVVHPGTHNKWMTLEDGRITDFMTVMTGEMFSLLRDHSLLAPLLTGAAEVGESFARGVRTGLGDRVLTAELFSVRARALLGGKAGDDASSFTSGLLIGADVRAGLASSPHEEIFVLGRPELTSLYAAALTQAGRIPREVDGEAAFLAGIHQIAEQME